MDYLSKFRFGWSCVYSQQWASCSSRIAGHLLVTILIPCHNQWLFVSISHGIYVFFKRVFFCNEALLWVRAGVQRVSATSSSLLPVYDETEHCKRKDFCAHALLTSALAADDAESCRRCCLIQHLNPTRLKVYAPKFVSLSLSLPLFLSSYLSPCFHLCWVSFVTFFFVSAILSFIYIFLLFLLGVVFSPPRDYYYYYE